MGDGVTEQPPHLRECLPGRTALQVSQDAAGQRVKVVEQTSHQGERVGPSQEGTDTPCTFRPTACTGSNLEMWMQESPWSDYGLPAQTFRKTIYLW